MKQRALITGAGRRIGREIALHLASQGFDVAIHYRNSAADAYRVKHECIALGVHAITIDANLSTRQGRHELVAKAGDMLGERIDLLVNSASLFEYDDAATFNAASLDEHIAVNFSATADLTLQLFQAHRETNTQGHSITLLDQKVTNLNTDYLSYTLSKLAAHASIRMLAQACAPYLRVNAISPGVTMVSGEMTQDDFESAHKVAALGRSSTADDIASAVLMLDQMRSMTGQTITVDGGQHLIPRMRDVAFGA
jgi:NAD(P)-dependent dehydrogenase (short-subunit alcohol dehydrogenase family)